MIPAPDMIGLAEAAHELGVSYGTALNLALTRQLEAHKQGHRWKVSRESVRSYRASLGAVAPTAA